MSNVSFIRHEHFDVICSHRLETCRWISCVKITGCDNIITYNLQYTGCSKIAKCSFSQAALNAAKQTKSGRDDEIAALRSELEVNMLGSRQFLP